MKFVANHHSSNTSILWIHLWWPLSLGQSCDYHPSGISRIHHTFHVFKTSIQGFIWMAYVNLCVILTTVYSYLFMCCYLQQYWYPHHSLTKITSFLFMHDHTWVFWMHHLSCKDAKRCIAFFSSSAWSALYSNSMILSSSYKAIRKLTHSSAFREWNYLSQLMQDFLAVVTHMSLQPNSRLSIKSHAIVPNVQLQPPSLFLWVLRFQCPERINTTQQNTPRGENETSFHNMCFRLPGPSSPSCKISF